MYRLIPRRQFTSLECVGFFYSMLHYLFSQKNFHLSFLRDFTFVCPIWVSPVPRCDHFEFVPWLFITISDSFNDAYRASKSSTRLCSVHDYGVLLDDEGISLRRLFIIDPKGTLSWAAGWISAKPSGLQTKYCQGPASWSFSRRDHSAYPSFPVHCTLIITSLSLVVKFVLLTGCKAPKPLKPIPSPS